MKSSTEMIVGCAGLRDRTIRSGAARRNRVTFDHQGLGARFLRRQRGAQAGSAFAYADLA